MVAAGVQGSSAAPTTATEHAASDKRSENPVLIGATVYPNSPRVSVPEEIAWLEDQVGSLEIRRVFDPNSPAFKTNFMDLAGLDVGHRATHYSFKPDISGMASGALDADVNTLLSSIPAGHRTLLTIWHEPEDNFTTDEQKATYRAAWQRFADLVHATGRPELTTSWVMMSYSWWGMSGRDPMDWYPGDAYVDAVGIDTYNEGSLKTTRWDSPGRGLGVPAEGDTPLDGGYVYGGAIPWIQSRGLDWGIAEFGSLENVNHIDGGWTNVDEKWKWIKQATRLYVHNGASFIEYFHCGPYRGPWWLDSSPESLASFKWALKRF
jgi:hypothetical protein